MCLSAGWEVCSDVCVQGGSSKEDENKVSTLGSSGDLKTQISIIVCLSYSKFYILGGGLCIN